MGQVTARLLVALHDSRAMGKIDVAVNFSASVHLLHEGDNTGSRDPAALGPHPNGPLGLDVGARRPDNLKSGVNPADPVNDWEV